MQEEIARLVHPVFRYGLQLKERLAQGQTLLLDVEQAALRGLLQTDLEARRWLSYGGEAASEERAAPEHGAFLGIRYALVCWLDELFTVDGPWAAQWNERKLEAELYGSNDRAWKFWEQARLAESRPESDPLEVFFLCVMLGFCGELRDQPERLRAWAAATQARIAHIRGQEWPYPAELDPPAHVPPLRGRDRLQKMVITGGLVLLVLIPLLAFFVVHHIGR